jgi:hypothetical protein
MKKIGTIEGCAIYYGEDAQFRKVIQFKAKMAICCDGMPKNVYGDPCWQRGTAYYNNGKYLNADKVPYIVVPPFIIESIDEIVLGSESQVFNTQNKDCTDAICGEVGPPDKLGEASCECARRIGLNPNPNYGGTDEKIIVYTIFVGEPAVVDGVKYKLQPS